MPLHFLRERDWLCGREGQSLSRGEVSFLISRKRILFLSDGGCLCLRENLPLRFIEEWSLPQKEIVSVEMVCVSERDSPPLLQRRNCLCLRRRLYVSPGEIASHFSDREESLSQKNTVSVSRRLPLFSRRTLFVSPREAVSVSEGGCL